ncbi:MAG TPA: carboxypeptidase regulatory-like domain-containing protein [Pyrinomonadaceae bacterium]|nr:carboxypeptidase regulatory-like domain-containing protein [Pyrinomonadaceae bacterium]
MNFILKGARRGAGLVLTLALLLPGVVFARQTASGTLRGKVSDEFGGVVIGATVTAADASGVEKTATTDEEGNYAIPALAPGRYTVRVAAPGFASYENAEVEIAPGRGEPLNIALGVSLENEELTVASEQPISIDNRGDALVLREKDIEALPDDPDELAAALQALAGPAAGPNGGQITIDGFEGGRIPPRDSIREIRINDNPIAADRDQPGFGGIQIFTKPGTDKWRGSASATFNDESMNARNPFAERRADFQFRRLGGNLSGTIIPKKSSFFFDIDRNITDDNDIVNATVLDPSALAPASFVTTVLTPRRQFSVSPRVDYALGQNHTLVARYNFFSEERENLGVSVFSLPERAFDQSVRSHTLQLTETSILNKSTINETRFQFIRNRREQDAAATGVAVNVLEAFFSGGATVGDSFNEDSRYELTNTTTIARGNHSFKFGGRVRGIRVSDFSENNFNGTFTFGGVGMTRALLFDEAGNPFLGPEGSLPVEQRTSLERFRRFELLRDRGLSADQLTAFGALPTQFFLSGGQPLTEVSQVDFGGFFQDDWKIRPNLTLGAGLRYEAQTNVSNNLNFAPRVFMSWSPDGGGQGPPKTVIRIGYGLFYDRIAENLTLQADRFNGTNQQQFILSANDPDPIEGGLARTLLARFPEVPTIDDLQGFALSQVTRQLAHDIRSPYTHTVGLIVERQLPYKFTVFGFAVTANTRHLLRSRNINAPLAGGERPNPSLGDVYQFESSGTQNMRQVNVGIRNQFSRAFSVFANYTIGKAESDADSPFSFPANSYDTSTEYGRTFWDARHRFTFGGNLAVPYLKLSLSPIVIARTGQPFNITTGFDNNRDGIFNDRPAFADGQTLESELRVTPWGNFDINPKAGQTIIPRNYGEGHNFVSVNLHMSRAFGFGSLPGSGEQRAGAQGGGQGGARGGPQGGRAQQQVGGGGPPGAIRIGPPGGSEQKRYNLIFSLMFSNLLNRTNLATPVGNLTSPNFGESLSTVGGFGGGGNPAAGNRRIQAGVRFTF